MNETDETDADREMGASDAERSPARLDEPDGAVMVHDAPEAIRIPQGADESWEHALARATLDSAFQAGLTIANLRDGTAWRLDANAAIEVLSRDASAIAAGDTREAERTMFAQGKTLDALFHALLERALHERDPDMFDMVTRLALRAQNASRATFATLAARRPPSVVPPSVVVHRADVVGHNVQINNATQGTSSESKLLDEVQDVQFMDTGATLAAVDCDPRVEAWLASTGPRTEKGKAIVSRNADKGKGWPAIRALRRAIGEYERRCFNVEKAR